MLVTTLSVAGLIFIIWSFFSPKKINLQAPDYILVSDFENHTNEEIFDYSLSEAMAITLRQSPYFNILPRFKISQTLSLMKMDPNSKIDEKLAIQIGKRESIPAIIAGEINKNNNKYIITASLINTIEEEKISLHMEEADNLENILEAMDKLANKIREDLGESAQSLSKYGLPLAQVTTSSIEALDLYSRGDILENFGKYSEATQFKEEALIIDTLFVKAISDLSYNYYKIGDLQKAVKFHNKILPLINLVSEHEKLSMLTVYYGPTFEMNYPKAYEYAKKWTLLYPNDAYGYAHLGHLAMFAGDFQIAINSNKRALELDSSIAGTLFNNTGYAYALNGKGTKAIENFKKSQNIRPGYFNTNLFLGRTFWMTNQLDSAIKHFKIALKKSSGIEQAKVLSHIIAHYHLIGENENAITECNNAITICRNEKRSDEEAYFHYLKGELEFEDGKLNKYFNEMEESERLSESPFFEYALIGLSFARKGYSERVERLLLKIKNIKSYDPHFIKRLDSYTHYFEGYLATIQNKYEKGIKHFENVKKMYAGDPIYLMAQKDIAHFKSMVSTTMAKKHYENLLSNSGELFMSYLPTVRKCGPWIGNLVRESNYELGLIFYEFNDTNNAVKYLENTMNYLNRSSIGNSKLVKVNQMLQKLK